MHLRDVIEVGAPQGSGVARATAVSHRPTSKYLRTAIPLQGHQRGLHLSKRDRPTRLALVPRAIDLHVFGSTQHPSALVRHHNHHQPLTDDKKPFPHHCDWENIAALS